MQQSTSEVLLRVSRSYIAGASKRPRRLREGDRCKKEFHGAGAQRCMYIL